MYFLGMQNQAGVSDVSNVAAVGFTTTLQPASESHATLLGYFSAHTTSIEVSVDEGRAFHTATVVKGWLIVAGGLGDDGTHDTHIMFHLRNGTWTVPELQLLPPVGCAGHFAVWLDKKNVLVIGGGCGRNPGGGPGPDMYFTHTMVMDAIWDFPSDAPPRWRQNRAKRIEQPTTARCAISAAIGESGVLYWGGADVNHTFNRGAHFLNLDGPPETWRYRTLDTPLGSRLAPSREGATVSPPLARISRFWLTPPRPRLTSGFFGAS